MDLKMKTFLGLKNVEKGVIQAHGKKIALIKVEPTNFAIRNNDEKEVIIKGFQKFLNSLDFPIQICVGTEVLNIDNYLNVLQSRVDETIKKTKNDLYKKQFDSYKEHLLELIKNNQVLNRSFYVVIPEKKSISLEVQTNVCLEKLKALDLKVREIKDNEEATQIIAGFFNNLQEDEDKSELLENDKISDKNLLHYLVAPKFILNHQKSIQVNNKLVRTITASGYPRIVDPGFMDRIITANGDFDLSLAY